MEESRLKQEADAKKTTGEKMETDTTPRKFNYYSTETSKFIRV